MSPTSASPSVYKDFSEPGDFAEIAGGDGPGMTSCLTPPIIVLVRPQLGQNIGKAARAMLNFGLTEMRLVAPRDGWPNPDAGPSASGADIVLEQARVFDSVEDGDRRLLARLSPRPCAAATSSCRWSGPSEMAERDRRLRRAAPRSCSGPSGRASRPRTWRLPTRSSPSRSTPSSASLNLAQAVILLAYEWSKHVALAQPPGQGSRERARRTASSKG